ncbi:serpin B10-like [Drosophila ficusphila]|uniref:serpin B10-like n=1 Tax=Drosophila ficusphila TaxID=30025 RepID=UPI0007E6984B|nr:serpin B10-like [Drosophila ficusphila]
MTVAVSIGLLFCQWFVRIEGSIRSELYPKGWPNRQYATTLHRAIAEGASNDISPGVMIAHESLKTAFGVLLASSGGSTSDEIREAMTFRLRDHPHSENTRTNHLKSDLDKFKESSYVGAYIPSDLKISPEFEAKIQDMGAEVMHSFGSSTLEELSVKLEDVSFKLRDSVSIDDLPFNLFWPELFILTADSFKAVWADADFHQENRRMREFNVDKRRRTFVDTLYGLAKRRQVAHLHGLRASMLILPLKDSRVKFMVLLPDRVNGLKQLESELEFVDLRSLLEKKMDTRMYDVRLPVINLLTNLELADNLGLLGIRQAFNPKQANFSRIAGINQHLWIRRFPHLTYFKLDENGINSQKPKKQSQVRYDGDTTNHFYASHPFFFALLDKHKIYATGRYGQLSVDPDDM